MAAARPGQDLPTEDTGPTEPTEPTEDAVEHDFTTPEDADLTDDVSP